MADHNGNGRLLRDLEDYFTPEEVDALMLKIDPSQVSVAPSEALGWPSDLSKRFHDTWRRYRLRQWADRWHTPHTHTTEGHTLKQRSHRRQRTEDTRVIEEQIGNLYDEDTLGERYPGPNNDHASVYHATPPLSTFEAYVRSDPEGALKIILERLKETAGELTPRQLGTALRNLDFVLANVDRELGGFTSSDPVVQTVYGEDQNPAGVPESRIKDPRFGPGYRAAGSLASLATEEATGDLLPRPNGFDGLRQHGMHVTTLETERRSEIALKARENNLPYKA